MPGATHLHLLLLAAGNASRFGSLKQCWQLEGVSLLRRAASTAIATGASVVVVTGAQADRVSEEIADLLVARVHNPDWEQGMGSSIACGFRYLAAKEPQSAATIVCLADQPLVGAPQLRRLIEAHRSDPERIIASDHGGVLGPPCLFPRAYYAELETLSGAAGARPLLQRHADRVITIPMPEAATDIDTPEDAQRLSL